MADLVASPPVGGAPPCTEPGLRERKKRATRRAIHRAALELAVELGVDNVTVAQIAERAGVSTRTLFNYFPTRDDALIGVDPELVDRLREEFLSQPEGVDTLTAWHGVLSGYLVELSQDQALWRLRREVAATSPQLWAQLLGTGPATEHAMVDVAVRRSGVDPAVDVSPVMDSFLAFAAVRTAMWQHVRCGFRGDLVTRLDDAFAHVSAPGVSGPSGRVGHRPGSRGTGTT